MSLYECTFVTRSDVSSQDVEALADNFSGIIKDGGGKTVKKEYWGLRTLAYKINKRKKGHYMFLCVEAPSDAVKEMERKMRLNEDVVRNMTIRVDAISDEDTPMLKAFKGTDQE